MRGTIQLDGALAAPFFMLIETGTLRWELGIITKKGAYHLFALRELLKMLVDDVGNSGETMSV